jgi:hypothetical protein
MFGNLFGKKQPAQSQTVGNVTTNGGQVGIVQAGGDVVQDLSGENAGQQQGLSGAEVAALLDRLMGAIAGSGIAEDQKKKLTVNLEAAKQEAMEASPDKALMGANLKKVRTTLKELKETTEAGKSLWETGVEVFRAIGPFVGLAAGFWG